MIKSRFGSLSILFSLLFLIWNPKGGEKEISFVDCRKKCEKKYGYVGEGVTRTTIAMGDLDGLRTKCNCKINGLFVELMRTNGHDANQFMKLFGSSFLGPIRRRWWLWERGYDLRFPN